MVGNDNSGREDAMGWHSCGTINDNEERVAEFCLNNKCIIGGTVFSHRDTTLARSRTEDARRQNTQLKLPKTAKAR